MKFSWKMAAAAFCYLLGIAGWCYVGVYMTLTKPVKYLLASFFAGEFSLWKLILALIQVFIYLSLAGAVWCIGYMGCDYFKSREKESKPKIKE